MKWRRGSDQPNETGEVIELTHPSGSILLHSPSVKVVDGATQIRGMVDAETWQRIRDQDVFGASTRTASPGRLEVENGLRLTVSTDEALPTEAVPVSAEIFVLVDAMFQIDPAELIAAGLEGEVWEGISFSAPAPWSAAIASLADEGFEVVDGLPSATTVRRDADGLNIEFRHHDGAEVVQVQVVLALPMGDEVADATYQVVNGINAALPLSTTMIDAGDLIIRDTVPDQLGSEATALIASRAMDLVGLMEVVREPLLQAARGELAPMAALEAMFA